MINMNNCQICGNLVRDPEIKTTSSGKTVATMTVAVNRYFVNQNGEKQEFTDYVRVKAWPPWAEAIGNQLQKGMPVFVEGRYSSYSYGKEGDKRLWRSLSPALSILRNRREQDRAILSSSERRRVNCRRRMMIYRFKGEEKWIQRWMW